MNCVAWSSNSSSLTSADSRGKLRPFSSSSSLLLSLLEPDDETLRFVRRRLLCMRTCLLVSHHCNSHKVIFRRGQVFLTAESMSEPDSEVLLSSSASGGSARFSGAISFFSILREQESLLSGIAFCALVEEVGMMRTRSLFNASRAGNLGLYKRS